LSEDSQRCNQPMALQVTGLSKHAVDICSCTFRTIILIDIRALLFNTITNCLYFLSAVVLANVGIGVVAGTIVRRHRTSTLSFYAQQHMRNKRVIATANLSVCPPVCLCPLRAGTVPRRMTIGSCSLHCEVAAAQTL